MGIEGTLIIEEFASEALRGNHLNDPSVREIPVYLPAGYAVDPGRRYPVIYWLHGFTGIGLSAINRSLWTPSLPQLLDQAVSERAPPAILVMPDGSTRYGGSQYLNSSATGQYEDYIVRDLVPYIDRKYRTKAATSHRGVDGKSSGGYGALVLAMRHPEVFGGVASHSGDMYFEACYKPFFWKAINEINKHGGLAGFLKAFDVMPKKSREASEALMMAVAMAMAYSPRPDGSYDLPFDVTTGQINDMVWTRWLEWDPVYLVERHAEALRGMKLIYFECGFKDEWNLHHGARILHRRMAALDIAHEYQEFDDDHTNINYRYVESLRRLAVALA